MAKKCYLQIQITLIQIKQGPGNQQIHHIIVVEVMNLHKSWSRFEKMSLHNHNLQAMNSLYSTLSILGPYLAGPSLSGLHAWGAGSPLYQCRAPCTYSPDCKQTDRGSQCVWLLKGYDFSFGIYKISLKQCRDESMQYMAHMAQTKAQLLNGWWTHVFVRV